MDRDGTAHYALTKEVSYLAKKKENSVRTLEIHYLWTCFTSFTALEGAECHRPRGQVCRKIEL
jgi:hypothetical protein